MNNLPNAVSNTLASLGFGAARSAYNLTLVPLLHPAAGPADYLTLDVALAEGLVEVTEISEGGSVPTLKLHNRGDRKVLLVDGEELVGARQNRVLNLSVLVPPRAELEIPVSCVEQGRWSYRSRAFRSEGRALHARARAEKMAAVSESLRSFSKASSDQGALWEEIGRKSQAMRVQSNTAAMADIYESHQGSLADYRKAVATQPGQVGAAFLVGGRLVGLELFDAPGTLERLLPKLVDSYAMDALEERRDDAGHAQGLSDQQAAELAVDTTQAFIHRVQLAKTEKYPGIGLGDTIRLQGPSLRAGALVEEGRVVHLSAYVGW